MNIQISNASKDPIYLQIKNQIKAAILTGDLAPGDQLPSIRFLAKELRISVITTKRAYDDLEAEGFIHSVQGKGSFVAQQNPDFLREEYLRKIEDHLSDALKKAQAIGLSMTDLEDILHTLGGNDHA